MSAGKRASGAAVCIAVLAWLSPAGAELINGFETDWVYVTRVSTNVLRALSEEDGSEQQTLAADMNFSSLTFAGTGRENDVRLFIARKLQEGDPFLTTDVELLEFDATGGIVNSALLSTVVGAPVMSGQADAPTIRYSAFHDTLLVAINPNDTTNTPATIYEIDLALTTRIHTYTGPLVGRRKVHVDSNARNGTLYVTNRNMANAPGPVDNLGDLIAFSTEGRAVGGTTSTFVTLIDGTTFQANDSRWTQPEVAIYRRRPDPADDTVVILTSIASTSPALEFYLDTTAHPVDANGNLALRGSPISVFRGFGGQQDDVTGHIWVAGLRGGIHVIRDDDSTSSFDTGSWWFDVDSPPIQPCNAPFADADGDGDVDADDFALFQLCYTGASRGPYPEGCRCFDRDRDGDVDTADFLAYLECVSGPSVPADPACGD